jgi:hypothetical protein
MCVLSVVCCVSCGAGLGLPGDARARARRASKPPPLPSQLPPPAVKVASHKARSVPEGVEQEGGTKASAGLLRAHKGDMRDTRILSSLYTRAACGMSARSAQDKTAWAHAARQHIAWARTARHTQPL